ncbi:S46 family peptidase [Ferrimonas sediminicola]|uniref:Dipeptidyl-peptidase n=1 Tax=Ferrimonas sediminicola TaxID=2569538 RepID=A0A4U1BDM9_9GAMM|nr:S46 family peptidase [Ferrimonas sediminicola]TKB48701.1 S46 family peptidase [Ferrimonas sediminicola]
MRAWLTAAVVALPLTALADEGMWQPYQIPSLEEKLTKMGLEIDAKSMADLGAFPMNAIINFGGCTASFVSPDGLVVTNHHCGYGAIQYHSTPEDNILENGFLAKTRSEEKEPVPGYKIWATESMVDVTDKVLTGTQSANNGEEYYNTIEANTKALVAECEVSEDYRCDVYNFHRGAQYFLIKELEIRDVRLVYTPSMSVGKYGGDIDNWMWPRHTGDFSFFRAYVGKDGRPADYSEENVPFQPERFLKVSAKGVENGDFVMVAGYPGRTNRYRTADEVQTYFEAIYPKSKVAREEIIELIKATSAEGSDARIKYESTLASLANYAKNFQSMIEGYAKTGILAKKVGEERALLEWINSDRERAKQYGDVINRLNALIEEDHAHLDRDIILGYLRYNQMTSIAARLYRLAQEKQKPDLEREPGYQERDWDGIKAAMQRVDRRYDVEVDKAILALQLGKYAQLPASERLEDLDRVFGLNGTFDAEALKTKLDAMYATTDLGKAETRLAWLDKSPAEFQASNDPFIRYAVATYDAKMKREKQAKDLSGRLLQVRPDYMNAIIAYNESLGLPVYADANSSLRLTFGTVVPYSPQDGLVAVPFTTLEGLAAKATGEAPFHASEKQLQLIKDKVYGPYKQESLGSVPVNFLTNLDSTGGNSGSPTMNGRGELVGLLFDGVYESITADWSYNNDLSRSIHVDSRYMLWVMKHLDGADNLLEEMEVVK